MKYNRQAAGFTIVELLIVIVVIAILAAITIVSYNGISERARASAAKSFASQIKHRDLTDAQGYWSFDECSGTSINNTAGSATSPTSSATGTVTHSTDTPSGTGCSFSFNGSSYLNTGISLSNDYYMKSAWVKTSSGSNIVSDGPTGANSAFYMTGGRLSAGHNNNWNSVQSTQTINDNKWHFVTVEFVRNGTTSTGTMTLTIDGTVVATATNTPTMTNPAGIPQHIGAYNNGNIYSGLMDDVMIITK